MTPQGIRSEHNGEGQRPGLFGHPWGVAALLFALAVALRWIVSLRILAIFNDGPRFIHIAQLMEQGRWLDALSHPYHPLYPLTIRIVKLWSFQQVAQSDAQPGVAWENAAVAASILAGSLAVVALYFFLREAFDPNVAWIGGVLMAAHPYVMVFSADVQSEGLYLACFLGAIALLWRALTRVGNRNAFAAGVCVGLAYLTRPEGLGVVAVGLGLGVAQVLRGNWSPGRCARFTLALSLGCALLAAPYVLALHAESGEWSLSRKKSLTNLAVAGTYVAPGLPARSADPVAPERSTSALEVPESRALPAIELDPIPLPPARAPEPAAGGESSTSGRWVRAALDLLGNAISSLRVELVLLTTLGLMACRGRPSERGLLVAALLAFYGVALYGLALNVGYLSRRHVLPPLLPLLGYAAVGVPILGGLVVSGARRLLGAEPGNAGAIAIGLSIALLVGLPKGLQLHRGERVAERRAAEWLREKVPPAGPVAAEAPRVGYYAGRPLVPLVRGGGGDSYRGLVKRGARYAIVDEAKFDEYPGFRDALGEGLHLIHREEAMGRRAIVLELGEGGGGR